MSPNMLVRFKEVQGIMPFWITVGEISYLWFGTVNNCKSRTRRPLMDGRDANILHGKKDLE